jgi:hypothetical protein
MAARREDAVGFCQEQPGLHWVLKVFEDVLHEHHRRALIRERESAADVRKEVRMGSGVDRDPPSPMEWPSAHIDA